MIKIFTIALMLIFTSCYAVACDADYTVTLETFGEGVTVELRSGAPGSSKIIKSVRSNGGSVRFSEICPGQYFLAIGNDDNVSITPVMNFQNNYSYTGSITITRGSGNVTKKSRKNL